MHDTRDGSLRIIRKVAEALSQRSPATATLLEIAANDFQDLMIVNSALDDARAAIKRDYDNLLGSIALNDIAQQGSSETHAADSGARAEGSL